MSSDTEIREWARSTGRDVNSRGKVSTDVRAEYEAAHPLSEQDDGEADVVIELPLPDAPVAEPAETASGQPTDATPRKAEVRPQGRKVTAADRFRERIAARPKKRYKRVSVEDAVTGLWGIIGAALTRSEPLAPMGRVLSVQAPVAGFVVEDVAKGTVVDKFLQPIARAGEQGKVAAALAGPPVLVGLLSLRPELAPVAQPMLETVLDYWMDIAGPAADRIEKRAAQRVEKRGGLDTHALVEWIFTGEAPVAPSEDEEAAIRRAQGM